MEALRVNLGLLVVVAMLAVSCTEQKEETAETETPVEKVTSEIKIWKWIHTKKDESDEELEQRLLALKDWGVEGLLIGGDDERTFTKAKAMGFDTHLWIWIMNRGELKDSLPELYAQNRLGESCASDPPYVDYYRWLCPRKPEVKSYLTKLIEEKASKPYIDGVHFDYIRYCDVILPSALWEKYGLVQDHEMPEYDYCYCDVCRSEFKEENGYDPLEIEDPSQDSAWIQFRYDGITEIVNHLSATVHGRDKLVSAAVFPTPSIAKKLVRQDWLNWDLDLIFPMIYQGFYEEDVPWIEAATYEGTSQIDDNVQFYPGLYCPDLKEDSSLKQAIEFSMKGGAKGVSVFGSPSDNQLDVLKGN